MDATTEQSKLWSTVQVYSFALVCLVMGMIVGFLLHAPQTLAAGVAVSAPPMAAGQQPTREQLLKMADKKAEPLLAELKTKPNDADLLAKIGDVYITARQFDAARPYYERSLAVKPENSEVLTHLASCTYFANDPDKAIALLQDAVRFDPKNSLALFNLGMLQWHVKADPKAAIAAWEAFQKLNPKDPKHAQVEQLIAKAKVHLNMAPGTKTDKPAM